MNERKWKTTNWKKVTSRNIDWGNDGIPEKPGVYVIYFRDKSMYVGSSSNLKKRLYAHDFIRIGESVRSDLSHVKFKTFKTYGYWLMTEARLIKRIKPDLNRSGHDGRVRNLEAEQKIIDDSWRQYESV